MATNPNRRKVAHKPAPLNTTPGKQAPEPLQDAQGSDTIETLEVLHEGCSVKESLFINAYLSNGLNGRRAAETAKYGTTYGSQGGAGFEVLKRPHVRAAVDKALQSRHLGKAEVLARLAAQAFASTDDLLDDKGNLDVLKARERGVLSAVQEWTETTDKDGKRKVKAKFYSAQRALELLGHAQDALKFNVEASGTVTLKDALGINDPDDKPKGFE